MIIFNFFYMWFAIFFILPVAGFAYVLWHVWTILPLASVYRWCAVGVGILAFAMMLMSFGKVTDHLPLGIAKAVYTVGYSSLFILLYLVMAFLLLDLLRLVHVVSAAWLRSNGTVAAVIAVVMAVVFTAGYINYGVKRCRSVSMSTEKPVGSGVTLMMLSDLHLGYHIGPGELTRLVETINRLRPDAVLIAGDIVDGNIRPLEEQHLADILRLVDVPMYACPGNHEYYAGIEASADFMRRAGITLLRDSTADVKGITVIGRDDRSNPHRKSLGALMKGVDKSRYTVLMDHQPYYLEQAERAGVDFQLSGHTHHGQLWPVSWITDAVYEVSHGEYSRGRTHYYVCPGYGLWGAKFRIGTCSEYAVLRVAGA